MMQTLQCVRALLAQKECARLFLRLLLISTLGISELLTASICQAQQVAQKTPSSQQDLLPAYFIPKSPTIVSLPRFDAQQLVNFPTGAAQLSIPLAEVRSGPLTLPFSLAYSYSGLQVYQPRELVGLGWSLQAGTGITLQINGLQDGYTGLGYNPDTVNLASQSYLKRITEHTVDTGPDIYSFSLPGGASGHFLLRDTTVVLLPQQPVRIRRLGAIINGFQVTTEEGIRYQFQTAEKTHAGGEFGLGSYYSAWQLTRIISASNADTIRLFYSVNDQEDTPKRSVMTTGYYSTNYAGSGGGQGDCQNAETYHTSNMVASNTKLSPQYLDSVVVRGSRVLCIREPGTKILQQVRVLTTSDKRREVKRFTCFSSFFDGRDPDDLHLRLDSVRESGGQLILPSYRFRYHTELVLPSRHSAAQDYWGYYNGAILNGGDAESPSGPALLADPRLGSLKANRDADEGAAMAGALQQVTYPTGGITQWDYEASHLNYGSGANQPTTVVDSLYLSIVREYSPTNHQLSPTLNKQVTYSNVIAFHLRDTSTIRTDLFRYPMNGDLTYKTHYRDFDLWRRESNGTKTPITLPSNIADETDYSVAYGETFKRLRFKLSPGNYEAQVYCEANEQTFLDLYVPDTIVTLTSTPFVGPPGAGVRVYRTRTQALGAPPLVQRYEYLVPDSIRVYGSGVQLTGGEGFSNKGVIKRYDYPGCPTCQLYYTSSDNSHPGDEFSKYNFYYSCVTVRDSLQQGATRRFYRHLPYLFNEVVLTQQQLFRQLPATQKLQLVQQDEYTYLSEDSIRSYPLLYGARLAVNKSGGYWCQTPDVYEAEPFPLRIVASPLRLSRQTRYENQSLGFTTLTRSDYRQQRLVRTATSTSTGWTIQRFKRLNDYAPVPAVTELQVNNFNPVIETQTWFRPLASLDSSLTDGHLMLYHPQWRAPASVYQLRLNQPQVSPNQETLTNGKYTSFMSDSRYERQATVHYAAPTGDLVQQQAVGGLPTSYLTGYRQTLVMAEAKNATYTQIAYTSFEPFATGRWQYDSTGTHCVLGGRTGRYAYQLNGTIGMVRSQLPAGDYELVYWAQGTGGLLPAVQNGSLLNGGPQTVATAPGNWTQYRTRLRLTGVGQVSLNGSAGQLDEVRLAPVGARMTTYTHEPLIGLTSQTGPDGRTTFFEYDGLGRLVRTRDEQGRILTQQQYHYATQR